MIFNFHVGIYLHKFSLCYAFLSEIFSNCTSIHNPMHCTLRKIFSVLVGLFCIPHTDGLGCLPENHTPHMILGSFLKNLFLATLCDDTGLSFAMLCLNLTHGNWQQSYRMSSSSHLLPRQ